jgi:hypothetical protein
LELEDKNKTIAILKDDIRKLKEAMRELEEDQYVSDLTV